jgi:poly-gamma-glutamate synthesis protein (capsule biosynthesis protein)
MPSEDEVSIFAVGDVAVTRNNPASAFSHTAPVLNKPDIMFGQLEATLSQKGSAKTESAQKPHPDIGSVLKTAGFDVMSFASNHVMDWGSEGLLDTQVVAQQNGIALIGAGKDINEARQPVIVGRKDVKVAFLAYNSILPPNSWATDDRPGCAPVRVRTFYEASEPYQPGSPSEVFTYPYQEDVQAMVADIEKVKSLADVVVISMHWGIHFMPAKLAMYQQQVAHAAIDAGADLILGSHPHILKGIEVYKGKVIFYSLGNFAMDSSITRTWPHVPARWQKHELLCNFKIDPEWGATYPFPADSRKTIVAKCVIDNKRIQQVSFLPALINKLNQPQVLARDDENFDQVVDYIRWTCVDQNLPTNLLADDKEVVITT